MMNEDEIYQDTGIGQTTPDLEICLPVEDVIITVSRTSDERGYVTQIKCNRKVRRYYAIGLLQEAIAMALCTNAEFIWTGDESTNQE